MSDERVWRALADNTRREILDLLRDRPRTTGELADAFSMSRYGVMKHLAVLVDANLVLVRRRGRQRWNYLNAVPLQEAIERWAGRFQREVASSLIRLRQISEAAEEEGQPMLTRATTVQIEQEIKIAANPERVFQALTERVNEWWGTGYRLLEENSIITLESVLGGRFYETSGNRQAIWAMVTGIEQGRFLELTGRMGMSGAVVGVVTFEMTKQENGTLLQLSHSASGDVDEQTLTNYSGGWRYLIGEQLKGLVEA